MHNLKIHKVNLLCFLYSCSLLHNIDILLFDICDFLQQFGWICLKLKNEYNTLKEETYIFYVEMKQILLNGLVSSADESTCISIILSDLQIEHISDKECVMSMRMLKKLFLFKLNI